MFFWMSRKLVCKRMHIEKNDKGTRDHKELLGLSPS